MEYEQKSTWLGACLAILAGALILLFTIGMIDAYAEPAIEEEEVVDQGIARCPFTTMTDQKTCMVCHETIKKDGEFKWSIKEKEWRNLPFGAQIVERDGKEALWYQLNDINDDKVFELLEYCKKHNIKELELDVFSPGGSVVRAWRIVGLFNSYPDIHITTVCNGFAASAAFVVLASGDTRKVSPYAMTMAHELWTLSFLKLDTPASSQDTAEDLRLWQDNLNNWLAKVSNLTPEEIHQKIYKRDYWLIGRDFLELGFADELTWDGNKRGSVEKVSMSQVKEGK